MKQKSKKRRIVLFCFLCIILSMCIYNIVKPPKLVDSGIDYKETTEALINPERGYLSNEAIWLSTDNSETLNAVDPFYHLFFMIGDFSNARNGGKGDKDFTQNMLDSLNQTFASLREAGATAILRFSYDNYDGIADSEPSMEQIKHHIAQLKPIFYENQDVITAVEAGFIGPWGEMHSSKLANQEAINQLINALLDAVPETRTISVRQPIFLANWLELDVSSLPTLELKEGTPAYRIGIYNDGYLGSADDLGTFRDRDKELTWLSKQATHTYYGGEIPTAFMDDYYLPKNCIPEMFLSHLTYLNGGAYEVWNNKYSGKNKDYEGETYHKYISDHMGYRFVLRKSALTKEVNPGGTLSFELNMENTGFGNIINEKEVELILVKDTKDYTIYLDSIDPRKWESDQVHTIKIDMKLPSDISQGNWNAYLRISNPNKNKSDYLKWCIAFANNHTWNKEINANYIGTFTVTKNKKLSLFKK